MKEILNYYSALKQNFLTIPSEFRLARFIDLPADCSSEAIQSLVSACAADKIGLIIPSITHEDFDYIRPMNYVRVYKLLLDYAENYDIKVALNLQVGIEESVVRYFDDDESIRSKVIMKREYYCTNEEDVKFPIGDEVLSVVAVEERGQIIDLRPFVTGSQLSWKAPMGNWRICRYFCADDEQDRVNLLDYDSCIRYLQAVLDLFRTALRDHIGKTLAVLKFSDICFSAINRRNWDECYNDLFMSIYGFDPAPFYPCLYDCSDNAQKRYKALLMDCRAKMLMGGMMKALADTARREDMALFGTIAEPKITAGSWIHGDSMLIQAVSPCAKLEKSYLYGANSLEIAQGAAEISGNETVACEAFQSYKRINSDIVYKETSTAFARGANMILAHLPDDFDGIRKYSEYVGRVQSVLRHGETVTDVAVLYPIYSLHSAVSLYESDVPEGHFEYPETPDVTDYMSVINSISSYSGRDLAVLHPESFEKSLSCGEYKVLVIPATEVISVKSMRAVAEFFDCGGKIICTGVLPKYSAEINEDGSDSTEEVKSLVNHVFGEGASDENITGDYIYNSNTEGGEAYFLYSTATGVDRCNLVPCSKILEALESFGITYDVYIQNMPRLECTGALNTNYPEYCLLGLSSGIRGGGMMSYIHKKNGDTDIYFFTNANDEDYNGFAYLKGEKKLEIWDAVNGILCSSETSFEEKQGQVYTKVRLKLNSGESILFVTAEKDT